MEFTLVKIVSQLILPPNIFIISGLLGLGLSMMWRKQGIVIAAVSLSGLLVCSLPVFSAFVLGSMQTYEPLTNGDIRKSAKKVNAIVVLAGGRRPNANEFGDDTVSRFSLERLRYAAWLTKRTGLPLIASGGSVKGERKSEAELMKDVLQNEFIVIVDLIEEQSKTTYENAKYTAELLKEKKYSKILLVTHAWHMRRAKSAFEHFDIEVVAGPTAFYGMQDSLRAVDFVPSSAALSITNLAFHELLGHWWYQIRFY